MQSRYRLRRKADFDRLRRSGRRWRHPLVSLVTVANDRQDSRFAFVASIRVGKATTRNRAKRLLREVVRQQFGEIQSGWDCLLIARRSTATANYSEVEAAVYKLFIQAGLFREALEEEESKLGTRE